MNQEKLQLIEVKNIMNIKLFFQAIIKFILGVLVIGLLLFIPANTIYYWNGWLFMGLLFVPMFITGIILMIKNPELLRKRLNAKETEKDQKKVIACSGLVFVFGFIGVVYSFLTIIIIGMISDKVMIGISQSKAFYVITENDAEIKEFFVSHLAHGVTIFDVVGGYTSKKQRMIMCILPTKEYYYAKEAIKQIDKKAFFVVTDAYEVFGGE